jgi:opacity protein-like surface antigen
MEILVVAVCLLTAAYANASAPDLRAEAGLRIRYDDNVFQYSDRNLGRFSPATLNKFTTLESTDDIIVTPSIDVRATWKGRYTTRLFAGVDVNQYTKNTDRSNQTYTLGVTRQLPHDTGLTLRYRFVPTHFGWRLADPPNQTTTYSNAELSSSSWRLAVNHDLNRMLSAELYGAWDTKDYNAPFNYRDITVKEMGLSGTAKLRREVSVKLGVVLETGDAAGAGDTSVNSDTSYDQWSVLLRPTISPTRDWDVALTYAYYQRDFTSSLGLVDENYYQREDTAYTVGIDSTVQVRKGIELRAEYDRIDRTSNKSGANLEFGNYTEQRVTIGAEYRF